MRQLHCHYEKKRSICWQLSIYQLQNYTSDQAFTANDSQPVLISIEKYPFFFFFSPHLQHSCRILNFTAFPSGNGETIQLWKITTNHSLSSQKCLQMRFAAEPVKISQISTSKGQTGKRLVVWQEKACLGSPAEHVVLYSALLILLLEEGWVFLIVGLRLVEFIFLRTFLLVC